MDETDVYVKLAGKVNFPKSRFIRRIFQKLVTPEEAEMLLALPASCEEFAAKFNMQEAEARDKLELFANKGVSIPLRKEGVLRYHCVSHIIQVHDATIHGAINKNYAPVPFEIVEMWKMFRETEWFEALRDMEESGTRRGRAVACWSSVKDHPELQPYENLRTILEQAPGIAVVDCPCRWLQVQQGTCDKPTFVCLSLTPGSVKYIEDRKIGRRLSLEEGIQLLEQCEEAGLIATTGGTDNVRQLCFCETDECIILRAQTKYGYDLWQPSRFQAVVDPEVCVSCETCVQRCPFGAVAMQYGARADKPKAVVDTEKCFGCGVCVVKCPSGALSMRLARPLEHIMKTA